MQPKRNRTGGGRKRAAAAIMCLLLFPVMIGFAALAIDVGFICNVAAHSQNTADAGALAGAFALYESQAHDSGEWDAWTGDDIISGVQDVIARNQKYEGYLSLEDQTIELGSWDSVNHVFTAMDPADWEGGAFAVRVVARRTQTPLFFAAVFWKPHTSVEREAVATGSGACSGIWGVNGVEVTGNSFTDSYDSTDGPYDSLTAGENGDVCSGRGINVSGSSEVHGDVMTGFGYEATVGGSAAVITGVTTSSVNGLEPPVIDFTDVIASNDNGTIGLTDGGQSPFSAGLDLFLNANDNLTLAPGTYLLDSITMNAQSSLTVTGPTTIYVTGDVNSSGATIVNATQDPSLLTLNVGGAQVNLEGHAAFYGSIFAPNAAVSLGGTSDFYGALIGGTVEMAGDFQFHVDESLALMLAVDPPKPTLVK